MSLSEQISKELLIFKQTHNLYNAEIARKSDLAPKTIANALKNKNLTAYTIDRLRDFMNNYSN